MTSESANSDMGCPVCGKGEFTPIGDKDGYHFVKCEGCGLRFTHPMPTPEVIEAYYTRYWVNEKNERNADRKLRKMRRVLSPLFKRAKGGRFLDVGCNTGFAVEAAREHGYEATGIDLSDEAIGIARRLYPENEYHHSDVQGFADDASPFDAVLCREVIEHLPEQHSFFDALARLTKPGGYLFVTTPDAGHRKAMPFIEWKEVIPPEHICFYDRDALTDMLNAHGFEVMRVQRILKPSLRVLARKRA